MSIAYTPRAAGWKPDTEWQETIDEIFGQHWDGLKPQALRKGLLGALLSRDQLHGESVPRWHISVQHRDRVPNWQEVARVGHELRPGVAFALGVPPRSWWINLHENVLHLWEIRDEPLLAQWRAESRGDRPT